MARRGYIKKDYDAMVRSIRRRLTLGELKDVASHGADSGFAGFTYTTDCAKFFEKYSDVIWEMAVEEAEDLGCKNVAEMISGFGRADMLGDYIQFKNLMAWYALETVARRLTDN